MKLILLFINVVDPSLYTSFYWALLASCKKKRSRPPLDFEQDLMRFADYKQSLLRVKVRHKSQKTQRKTKLTDLSALRKTLRGQRTKSSAWCANINFFWLICFLLAGVCDLKFPQYLQLAQLAVLTCAFGRVRLLLLLCVLNLSQLLRLCQLLRYLTQVRAHETVNYFSGQGNQPSEFRKISFWNGGYCDYSRGCQFTKGVYSNFFIFKKKGIVPFSNFSGFFFFRFVVRRHQEDTRSLNVVTDARSKSQ